MCNYLISNKEELKDLIYFFGILISVSISFFSLIITIKNRRNQLRESLYKEQINFASKLSNEFYNIHYDLIRVNKGNESNIQMATTKIENIFELIFSNSYLISNELIIDSTIEPVSQNIPYNAKSCFANSKFSSFVYSINNDNFLSLFSNKKIKTHCFL